MSFAESLPPVSPAPAETYLQGEALFTSFLDSLSLVITVEKRYSNAVLKIGPQEVERTLGHKDLVRIKSLGDRLNTVFYGEGPHRDQYDAIINKALASHIEEDPDSYGVLADPAIAMLAQNLVRAGMMRRIRQDQVDLARNARHHEREGHKHHQHFGQATGEMMDTRSLILFNHMIRDLIESPAGRRMNLDRQKVAKIIKLTVGLSTEEAEHLEMGISLEVAVKHMFERMVLSPDAENEVVYGGIEDDRVGGDLILFPKSRHPIYLDVKQTPPGNIKKHMSHESANEPGSFLLSDSKAVLWLGYDHRLGNNFGLPSEFQHVAAELLEELSPRYAIA